MSIDALAQHASVWSKLHQVMDKNRLPHAFLFVGPRHANSIQLVNRLISRILCQNPLEGPCEHCKPCHLLSQGTHPDILYVNQDTSYAPIKVDQVRELQQTIYQTPQCGDRRFIVIEPADKLNTAAANALLKILEEPPSHTIFVLIAEQTGTLPATIISRCQQYIVPALALESAYSEDNPRALLLKQSEAFGTALCDLINGKTSPCTLAVLWSTHALGDLLWFLYLFTAQVIKQKLNPSLRSHPFVTIDISLVNLFKQLDQISALLLKVQQNITLNQTLAIEVLLLGYLDEGK